MLGSVASPSHRELFVDALTRAATESGYGDLDVDRIADYAGLPVEKFYDEFATLEQCRIAALERFIDRLSSHMEEECSGDEDWPIQVKAAILAGLDFISELDVASRLFLLDASGPAASERRLVSIRRAADALKPGRGLYRVAADYPVIMEQTLVTGVVLVVLGHLLAEEASLSPQRKTEVVELVLTPYLGTREARRIATA
jgi:AcrR family transcriptional regulator